ncbi:hypothetical protein Mapa_014361 [Marchantia paleacea]|nr:hypothetical protein Mapa_014361 [Marchantia paleacea]
MLLCTLHMGGHWIGQVQEFRGVGCHSYFRSFESVIQTRVRTPREIRGKPTVVEVIDKFRHLSEHELAHCRYCKAQIVHGHSNRCTLEVSTVHCLVSRYINEWVVIDGIDLPLNRMSGCTDDFNLGSQPLRRGSQCVSVLLGLLQWVRFVEFSCGLHV